MNTATFYCKLLQKPKKALKVSLQCPFVLLSIGLEMNPSKSEKDAL